MPTGLPRKAGRRIQKRCYLGDYRFSEDLDFSGIVFTFDREDRQKHENSYTFYLRYVGPLPSGNDVKVDVTLREQLVYPLRERLILRGYEEFTDLPEDRKIQVYSLEEIATEKTMAPADGARNEPRDLYDLWHLTSNAGIDLGTTRGRDTAEA